MYNSDKNYRAILHEKVFFIYQQIGVTLLFLYLWIYDSFLILKNIQRDVNKYNLDYFSILYNTLIKYPLLGFRPSSFFMYKLYKNSYKDYLTFFQGISKVIWKNKHLPHLLDNKLEFKLHISDKIKTPNLIADFDHHNKKIFHYAKPQTNKIVIKPIKGMWGKGIKIITSDKLSETLKNCSKSCIVEDYIEQHRFINKIFSGSINTIRILTLKKNSRINIIHMILRVGRASTKHLDNIAQGGISINIDMDSGSLGKGYTFYEYGHNEYTSHPDTNYKFYGRSVPYTKEAQELAIAAHKFFPMFTLIGWDIALTENRPTVVEGNRMPDLSLHQIHEPLKKKLFTIIINKNH